MFHKTFSLAGMLLLAGAAVFATAEPGQAQHTSAGHAGGGHFGGYHGGSYHGSFHPSFGYHQNYPHYSYRHYQQPHYGYYNHHYYGSSPYLGYYDPYPYYGSYPYDSYGSGAWSGSVSDTTIPYSYGAAASDPYPYDNPSLQPDLRDSGSYPYNYLTNSLPAGGSQTFSLPSAYTLESAPVNADHTAGITVRVPADAQIWFEGSKTNSTGPSREFRSPPLTPGYRYTYEVRARWKENGQDITQTRHFAVSPGGNVNVDFLAQSATEEQGEITKAR